MNRYTFIDETSPKMDWSWYWKWKVKTNLKKEQPLYEDSLNSYLNHLISSDKIHRYWIEDQTIWTDNSKYEQRGN